MGVQHANEDMTAEWYRWIRTQLKVITSHNKTLEPFVRPLPGRGPIYLGSKIFLRGIVSSLNTWIFCCQLWFHHCTILIHQQKLEGKVIWDCSTKRIILKSTTTTDWLFGNYCVHEVSSGSPKIHKVYANGKREKDMEYNTVNPWRRCSWMEHRLALRACLVFMKAPYTSHRRTIFLPNKMTACMKYRYHEEIKEIKGYGGEFTQQPAVQYPPAQYQNEKSPYWGEGKKPHGSTSFTYPSRNYTSLSRPLPCIPLRSSYPSVTVGNKNNVINFPSRKRFMVLVMEQRVCNTQLKA